MPQMLADPVLAVSDIRIVAGTPPGFGGQRVPVGLDYTIEAG